MAELSQKWLKVNVLDGAGDGIVTYSGNRRTTAIAIARKGCGFMGGRGGVQAMRALVQMRKQGEQARSTYWCRVANLGWRRPDRAKKRRWGRMLKLAGPRRKVGC